MKAVKLLRRTVKCCAVIATAVKAVADEKCEDCDFCLVFLVHEQNLGYRVSETVATLGTLEGGARREAVGGIGPKGRSFRYPMP